jgi:hypothetical protein
MIESDCLRVLLKWRGEDDEVEIEERTEEVVVIDDDSDSEHDELDYYANMAPYSPELEIVSWKQHGRGVDLTRKSHQPPPGRPLHRKSLSANAPFAAPPIMAQAGQLVLAPPRQHMVVDLTDDADVFPPYTVKSEPNSQ